MKGEKALPKQRVWIQRTLISEAKAAGNGEGQKKRPIVRKKSIAEEEEPEWEWQQAFIEAKTETGLVVHLVDGSDIPLPGQEKFGEAVSLPAASLTTAGRVVLANQYPLIDDLIDCPHDLIQLTHLHEPSVVECLQERFFQSLIYTRTGPVLIALNPFEKLSHLYSSTVMADYWHAAEKTKTISSNGEVEALPPHVFEIADGAFRQMQRALDVQIAVAEPTGCQQSILVSGESGAGKTVTTKLVMKYLASLSERLAKLRSDPTRNKSRGQKFSTSTNPSGRFTATSKKVVAQPMWSMTTTMSPMPAAPRRGRPNSPTKQRRSRSRSRQGRSISPGSPRKAAIVEEDAGTKDGIESQVLQSNPILESFGNARTVRNDNSSRFGKFIEIQFTRLGQLVGAQIETYLLEKVRLVQQSEGERNYHIFYELLSGNLSEDEMAEYRLTSATKPTDFPITSSGTYDRRDKVSDKDTFAQLRKAMGMMKFDKKEQHDIFGTVAAVLHGSNIKFAEKDEGSELIKDDETHTDALCHLMGLEVSDLETALCSANVTINKKVFERKLNLAQAEKGMEAFLKTVYGALFTYLVQRINDSVTCKDSVDPLKIPVATIGVLDIFGFESFKKNSFEQLCINFCNETLQQQFNAFVLQNEQAEYTREGIDWSFIEFPQNQDVLDLIDKRGKGILNILDDHCRTPRPSDKAYALDVYKICEPHSRFSANKKQTYSLQFSVEHYAGPVEYTMGSFTEKNNDDLPKEALELLSGSSSAFVRNLTAIMKCSKDMPSSMDDTNHSSDGQRATVSEQFRRQLKNLRAKIDKTSPHYIRCLKPNASLEPGVFDTGSIAEQLRCGGILEAVRVSRAGFAQHYSHGAFISRYGALVGTKCRSNTTPDEDKEQCAALVRQLNRNVLNCANMGEDEKKQLQMGKSKVFLTRKAFEALEQGHGQRQEIAATKLNAVFRRFLARKNYFTLAESCKRESAEKKRQEALELEARERRLALEKERRLRMGISDDEADEGVDANNAADFAFDKLLGYAKVKTENAKLAPLRTKSSDELKWVCENGQWLRRRKKSQDPVKPAGERSTEENPAEAN